MKNILVPIDFTGGSKKALQYAIHFAKQFKSRLTLLHILTRDSAMNKDAMGKLKAWAEEFVPAEIPVQLEMCQGAEAIEIVNTAKKTMAGLMVISTHGRRGRAHALAGSLAENLVQLAPCPVLVVREQERDFIETPTAKNKTEKVSNFIGMSI